MSIMQELENSMRSDAPCYIEFLYRYDPKKKQAFAFYEGDEDSGFYNRLLRNVLDTDCELEEIVAGCKNNVLKLQREFDWSKYSKKQILFFVDRDLSYWLGDNVQYGENVFVTDGYSVENYVTNPQGFRNWLIHYEGFARAKKEEINDIVDGFKSIITLFEDKMMPIMAMAVVAKRKDRNVSLSDYKLSIDKNLRFTIQDKKVDFEICEVAELLSKWKLHSEHRDEIKEQIHQFVTNKEHYCVRGKWILYFMAAYGEHIRMNANIFAPSLESNGKIPPTCAVPINHCLSAIAPYCNDNAPERLKIFLEHTYSDYFDKAS